MSELSDIIPFYCQFPYDTFLEKIMKSKPLSSLESLIVPFEEIEHSVDVLVQKYPELPKDVILCIASFYVQFICTSEVFQIIALYHKDINLDLKHYFINLKRRIKETPKNIIKSQKLISDYVLALNGELLAKRHINMPKEKLDTFNNVFDNKKLTAKNIIDNFIIFIIRLYEQINQTQETPYKFTSLLPGSKYREILRKIPLLLLEKYNQRELYRDLFQFLNSFAIKEDLWSEGEYEERAQNALGKEFPYETYKDYMANKVKIIFGLT